MSGKESCFCGYPEHRREHLLSCEKQYQCPHISAMFGTRCIGHEGHYGLHYYSPESGPQRLGECGWCGTQIDTFFKVVNGKELCVACATKPPTSTAARPWKLSGSWIIKDDGQDSDPLDRVFIANCCGEKEFSEANAALIVEAVNEREGLKAEQKYLNRIIDDMKAERLALRTAVNNILDEHDNDIDELSRVTVRASLLVKLRELMEGAK